MKVSHSRYPILEFFDKNSLSKLYGKINYRGEDGAIWNVEPNAAKTVRYSINEMYQGYIADRCGQNVYILMPKFQEAIVKTRNVFKNVSRGVQLEKLFEDCCIFSGDLVFVCYKLTNDTFWGYTFNTAEQPNNYVITIYYQGKSDDNKERKIVYLGTMVFGKKNEKAYRIEMSLLSTYLGLYAIDYKDNEKVIDEVLAILLFKHYAKVELDIIHAREKKISEVAKEKVINETLRGVHIMDSNWYTTIYLTEYTWGFIHILCVVPIPCYTPLSIRSHNPYAVKYFLSVRKKIWSVGKHFVSLHFNWKTIKYIQI